MPQLIVPVYRMFEVYCLWQIGGIHPENCRLLKTDKSTEYALSPESLSAAISHDIAVGLIPFFLCGTVSVCCVSIPSISLLHTYLYIVLVS